MDPGTLVFINGNQAAIVLGDGVGDDGLPDGSLIVGTFAGAEKVEAGHYGARPGPKGENPPSYVPEGARPTLGGPVQTFLPTAGGTEAGELAPVDEQTGAVLSGDSFAPAPAAAVVGGAPIAQGDTAVDFNAAQLAAGVDPTAANTPQGAPPGWRWNADSRQWEPDPAQTGAWGSRPDTGENTATPPVPLTPPRPAPLTPPPAETPPTPPTPSEPTEAGE